MNSYLDRIVPAVATVLVALMLTGCATPINWKTRVGVYTYNQAVIDYGTPMVMARLDNGSIVADWMTRRGTVVVAPGPIAYSPGFYVPRGIGPDPVPTGYSTTYFPAQFLHLEFDANEHLTDWKKYAK